MSGKKRRVCPVAMAGSLDNRFRRWLQNPRKILGPYIKEGMIVLDIGCGPGFFAVDIARMVGKSGRVIASDLQEGMLRKLKDKIRGTEHEERITLHKCEENRIGISGNVDFVLAVYVLHEVPDQEKFFEEIKSILKPDGRVFIMEPSFHVSKRAFEETVRKAGAMGLTPVTWPEMFLSRAVILKKAAGDQRGENYGTHGSEMNEQQQLKAILKETFDSVAEGYDCRALRFFPESARNMAEMLCLHGDEHVLDVACGTGHASLLIARMLQEGRITAVDFSSGMLAQARQKAASLKIRNIDFAERDMQVLGFPESTFDVAVCAFGIFFVINMEAQLAYIASMVKPGGRVMISNFEEGYFNPLKDLFIRRLADYGVQEPPQAWKRIANEAGCRQLFETAGLRNVRVEQKNIGYYLESADEWWDIVWNAGFRRLVSRLSPQDRERFRREHLEEIGALRTGKGIWLDVGVLYTVGTKA